MSMPLLRPFQSSLRRLAVAGPSRLPYKSPRSLPRAAPFVTSAPLRTISRPSTSTGRVLSYVRYHSTTSQSRHVSSEGAAKKEVECESSTGESGVENGGALRIDAPAPGAKSQPIAKLEPRLSLTFTCTADACGHRSTHEFSKRSYTRGLVLVQCPSCKNRHLIADHLGWFKESTEDGTLKTVEDLLRAKGEKVRTGKVNFEGDIEYDPEAE